MEAIHVLDGIAKIFVAPHPLSTSHPTFPTKLCFLLFLVLKTKCNCIIELILSEVLLILLFFPPVFVKWDPLLRIKNKKRKKKQTNIQMRSMFKDFLVKNSSICVQHHLESSDSNARGLFRGPKL